MMDEREFADIEALVIRYLRTMLGPDIEGISNRTPPKLEQAMPWVRVTAGPGTDDEITEEALVDVEVFAATREDARDLAERIRTLVRNLTAHAPSGSLVDRMRTATRPQYVSYANPAVQRYVASYRLWHRAR